MTPQTEEARRLLRLARRDRETFDLLFPLPRASIAALGFHAQQSTEKSIKAVAVLRGMELQRTHDLAALGQAILDHGGLAADGRPATWLEPFRRRISL